MTKYQELFNYIAGEFDFNPLQSQMMDIINIVHQYHPKEPKPSKWIKVTDKLPPFGKTVLWRGVLNWAEEGCVSFFSDKLTEETEGMDYGYTAYYLDDKVDFLVSQQLGFCTFADEYASHWCEIDEESIEEIGEVEGEEFIEHF